MQIVKFDLGHVDHVAPLFDAYRQFYGKPADLAGAARFLRERCERGESTVFFASPEVGDPSRTVGFVQTFPAFSSLRMRPIVILNDLFVQPEWRGKHGIAQALCNRVHELARERGAAAVVLETAPDNVRAQALYHRLDYVLDGMSHYQFTIKG